MLNSTRIIVIDVHNTHLLIHIGDSVCGVSVRIRTTDDVIQIWNDDSSLANKSTVRYICTNLCVHMWLIGNAES